MVYDRAMLEIRAHYKRATARALPMVSLAFHLSATFVKFLSRIYTLSQLLSELCADSQVARLECRDGLLSRSQIYVKVAIERRV